MPQHPVPYRPGCLLVNGWGVAQVAVLLFIIALFVSYLIYLLP